MIFSPPSWLGIALNVGVWAAWSVGIGYGLHRRSVDRFARDGRLTRLRAFECDGHWYERRLRIRRWKDRLPELGALFTGGFAKRRVERDPVQLARFVAETRRAEIVHWVVPAIAPVFALWNPPWAIVVMFAYATIANVPCLLVQRYNRARLLRVLTRLPLTSDPNP